MTPSRIRWAGLIAAALLSAGPLAHAGTLYLYDAGLTSDVRLDRWQASDIVTGGAQLGNTTRSSGGGVFLYGRFAGDTVSTGHVSRASVGLTFLRSRDIREIQVTLTPTTLAGLDNCGLGAPKTFVEAGIEGAFFNSSTTSHAGDRTGDVVAGLHVRHYPPSSSSLKPVYATMGRCDDAACSIQTYFAEQLLTYVTVGGSTSTTLRLEWDAPNHQFLFAVNGNSPASFPYTLNDRSLAHDADKRLEVQARAVGCPAQAVVTSAGSYFENVMTNVSMP